MTQQTIHTSFRAYYLSREGASFSYATNDTFTLIEARMTKKSESGILAELALFKKKYIDVLHITSWDEDHCNDRQLVRILELLKPSKIEYPGYKPHSYIAKDCLNEIIKYKDLMLSNEGKTIEIIPMTPRHVRTLWKPQPLESDDVICWPFKDDTKTNNNSTVKIFKHGAFNVASLGDVEDMNEYVNILRYLVSNDNNIDIITLAHHGSDCDNNSIHFFDTTEPTIAVCASNAGNIHNHPHPEVKNRLKDLKIPLYITATSDVIIQSFKESPDCFTVHNSNTFKIKKAGKTP